MKGVILAGGNGTRLREISGGRNKQTVEVADKPMIHYPITTLAELGCKDVVIVSSPSGAGELAHLVSDGSELGVNITYKIQAEAKGTADALSKAGDQINGLFPLIMGDVFLDPTPKPVTKPTLFWNEFETAHHHSVIDIANRKVVEKPSEDVVARIGKKAVVFYYFDEQVFDYIPSIKPSERGELELIDIHQFYLDNGADIEQHKGFFADMGTPAGISRMQNHLSAK